MSDKDGKINFLTVDFPLFSETAHQFFAETRTSAVAALGNLDILQTKKLAFFCSVKCPGEIILQAYELAQSLRGAGITVMSGFHSPVEKEIFNIQSRSTHPIIACLARSIEGMRLPKEYKKLLAERRLLLLSPFKKKIRRSTVETSTVRNQFVADMAEKIFVAYAAPDSKTEHLCKSMLQYGKQVFTLSNENNGELIKLGAIPVEASNIKRLLA